MIPKSGRRSAWAAAAVLASLSGTAPLLSCSGSVTEKPEADDAVRMMRCIAAGDYRWVALDPQGRLRSVRANRVWRVIEAGERHLSDPALERLDRLADLARSAPPPESVAEPPGVEVEEELFTVALSGAPEVFSRGHGSEGTWRALVAALEEQLLEDLEPLPRRSFVAALPAKMLTCLGIDRPILQIGTLPGSVAAILRRSLGRLGGWMELTPGEVRALQNTAFPSGHVIEVATRDDRFAVVLAVADPDP